MIPVIALVGRPNVGKSTLFNRLTRSRNALVADMPGLTRDRLYGQGVVGSRPYLVVDTGGLGGEAGEFEGLVARQAMHAVAEADAVLLLVDARVGLTGADEHIAGSLRRLGARVHLVVNKSEHQEPNLATAEFQALALGSPHPISATHGRGIDALMRAVLEALPPAADDELPAADETGGIRLAVVGRPNVGKSTLVNRLLGEERVLASDLPGTTRDSVVIPFRREGYDYVLVDTAGIRRRSRVTDVVEKFSVVKTLQSIEQAHVAILVVDARQGIGEQDATVLGMVLESGRGVVVAVNKWDRLEPGVREQVRQDLRRKLVFLDFARFHFISALYGSGLVELLESAREAHAAATRKLSTPELTRILEQAVAAHSPPMVQGRSVRLRYAHQGGQNPPVVVVHGNRTEHVPTAYRRYLANTFRKSLGLWGTPVRVEFKAGVNPYQPHREGRGGARGRRHAGPRSR